MSTAITFAALKTLNESPARVLALPSPDSVVWNKGIEEQIINMTNDFGELQFDEAIVSNRQPAITLNYGKMTAEIMALLLGFKLQSQNITDALMCGSFRAEKGEYAGATSANQEGHGMVADQSTSEMYALINGLSVALTRQTFGTFDPAVNNSFAQGAHGATKLSTNLVATRTMVTRFFLYPVNGAYVLSHDPFDTFSCTLLGVLTENSRKRVFELKFSTMQLNKTDSNEVDFRATPIPIPFRITDTACVPRLRFFNRERLCAA